MRRFDTAVDWLAKHVSFGSVWRSWLYFWVYSSEERGVFSLGAGRLEVSLMGRGFGQGWHFSEWRRGRIDMDCLMIRWNREVEPSVRMKFTCGKCGKRIDVYVPTKYAQMRICYACREAEYVAKIAEMESRCLARSSSSTGESDDSSPAP